MTAEVTSGKLPILDKFLDNPLRFRIYPLHRCKRLHSGFALDLAAGTPTCYGLGYRFYNRFLWEGP
jgi:hypothetical protein